MGQTRKLLVGASVPEPRTDCATGCFAGWRAKRALRLATEEFRRNESCAFETHPFAPPLGASFEIVSAARSSFRQRAFRSALHRRAGRPSGIRP